MTFGKNTSIVKCIKYDNLGDHMAESLSRAQLQVLERSFLFARIDEISLERVISDQSCQIEVYPKGAVVQDPAHVRRCLGIVLSGVIRLDRQDPEGRYPAAPRLQPGDSFGAESVFSGSGSDLSMLTAETAAEVLLIPEARLWWAMRRDFTMIENYIRHLSERIRLQDQRIANLTAGSVTRRLAGFLLARPNGVYQGSMTGLSVQMNVSRASLYRAMEALETTGSISRSGKTIRVLDPESLKALIS